MKLDFVGEFPPYFYFRIVLRHYPKAAFTYANLWEKKDQDNQIFIRTEDVKSEYLTSIAKFRHDLFLLSSEGLVNFEEDRAKGFIKIEMTKWDDEDSSAC